MTKVNNRVVYILIGIIVVLVLALAAAVGALLWKYSSLANGLDNLGACKSTTEKGINIQDLYPRFFRTAEEQATFVKEMNTFVQNRPSTPTYRATNCSLSCPAVNSTGIGKRSASQHWFSDVIHETIRNRARKKRQSNGLTILDGPHNHACCQSYSFSITPDTAFTMSGDVVDIVQLNIWKQYFVQEHCEQERTCSNCQCEQPTPYVYEAVIYKDKDATDPKDMFDIEYIQVPGCCKCLNIGRRRGPK